MRGEQQEKFEMDEKKHHDSSASNDDTLVMVH